MVSIKVLDLGSGQFPYKAEENEIVTHVDFRSETVPDIVHDLSEYPYPLEESSYDVVYASHILEHLPDNIRFMEEVYRICKHDGKVIIRVPHFSGRSAWCDPTHLRAYSYYQFYYYGDSTDHYGDCFFDVNNFKLCYTRFPHGFFVTKMLSPTINFFASLNPKICEKTWCYWVGGFSEIIIEMRPVKGKERTERERNYRENLLGGRENMLK